MNSAQMIIKYWLKSRKDFVFELIYLILSTIFYALTPVFIGRLIGGLDPNNSIISNFTDLVINFTFICIFAFLRYITNRAARLRGSKVSSGAIYHLRKDINNAINRQSFSYFDKIEIGQLISRTTSDIEETQQIFGMGLILGLQSSFSILGIIIGFFFYSLGFTLILIVIIIISIIISYFITKKLKPIFLETRESFGELTNTIRENIIGAEVVRIFNTQEKELNKFLKNNERFLNASINTYKYNSLFTPIVYVIIGFLTTIILLVGGISVIEGEMTLEALIVLQSYIALLGFPLMMIGQIMLVYIQADAALTRAREVLESNPEIEDCKNPIKIKSLKGDIEFKNVSFGYIPGHKVLKGISFKVPAGKTLAILGTTGSGKSTIINLIPRFYDVNEGVIKIDGIDIRKYSLKDLRKNIGIVSQETFLFNKSIAENIAFGVEKASKEDIINAAKAAHLHNFIKTLPNGYDSIVGERGTRLSGGQKQRLTIARALIVKPKILIFDDSTSSVDVETEYEIQKALAKLTKNTTTIIITQRISTIRNADLILILDRGRVIGFGTHDELIKSNPLYRQIYETLHQKQELTIDAND